MVSLVHFICGGAHVKPRDDGSPDLLVSQNKYRHLPCGCSGYKSEEYSTPN
jgi:hypothetical protein